MSDYFGYDVFYAMNITDIDDKIITRARQNYLVEQYMSENHSLTEVIRDAKEVLYFSLTDVLICKKVML